MVLVEAIVLIAIGLLLLYKWSTAKYHVLSERGVPHEKPRPLFGNLKFELLKGKLSYLKLINEQFEMYKDYKVYGTYVFREPAFVLRDLECIKKVCIKDFDVFMNHKSNISAEGQNPLSKSLIALQDRKWKTMRHTLTPTFTGSKMRQMVELLNETCLEAVRYLEQEAQADGRQEVELEMKDYFTRFTNDMIATVAFGIKVNSFVDKDNEFHKIGAALTAMTPKLLIKGLLLYLVPKLMKVLGVRYISPEVKNYFDNLVLGAMKYRQEHNVVRPDMIHLLMEAKKRFDEERRATNGASIETDEENFSDEDMVAQCLLFFLAGFETVSTCLCFTAHELLANPDVQQRLYEEILEVQQELGDKPLNYDALMQMKYMDQVLSESLRKWPPALSTDRVCAKDYDLTDDEGNVIVQLKKGDNVLVPIYAIQHDPQFFENPQQFDPERFSEENKKNMNPLTFLAFGAGPRNCIGNRLALMETKAIIYHMLLRFRIVAGEKTSSNLFESIVGFQLKPKEGFWMKFVPRATAP